MRTRWRAGFTMVELMIVVIIIGVLASVAIPSFIKYARRSKTAEAVMNLRSLFDSTAAYYVTLHADSGGAMIPAQFPANESYMPAQGAACSGGRPVKCTVASCGENWSKPVWHALNFRMDDPHFFSYGTTGGSGAAVGDTYHLMASGDLNCDSVYSLYERAATVISGGMISGGAGISITNEVE